MPVPNTVVLNSSTGNSSALSVDYRFFKPVTVVINTQTSGSSGDFTVQYTLNDIVSSAFFTSSGVLAAPTWLNATSLGPFGYSGLSSSITSSAGYTSLHFESSVIDTAAGLSLICTTPIAGVRLNSTALSTSLTLTLLQPNA